MAGDHFGRFWTLLRRMPCADKSTLVEQYTRGRTIHLHEMSKAEYDLMCNEMERVACYDERKDRHRQEMKKLRSVCLRQMTLWGVNTRDWSKVDAFCENPRISGKPFRHLRHDDLTRLNAKLHAMIIKREKRRNNDNIHNL